MDLIKQGYEVLYIWNDQKIEEIEQQVTEIKKIAKVSLENAERLSIGKFFLFERFFNIVIVFDLQHHTINRHSTSFW